MGRNGIWVRSGGLMMLLVPCFAQQAPAVPDRAMSLSVPGLPAVPQRTAALDPVKSYTLAELIDFAERNNPRTRAGWERARQRADSLGIARAALYPSLAAVAAASLNQYSLFYGKFYREDTALFPATLNLSYTVFDFGARDAQIDLAKANLLAADLLFNDAHRTVAIETSEAYYRLLDAMSREGAAAAALEDARTLQEAIEARLANGLATFPDTLEARAVAAQAAYELASVRGLAAKARGALASVLGFSPTTLFQVQQIEEIPEAVDQAVNEPVDAIMKRALAQRPDLLAQFERIRATDAEIHQARAAWAPTFTFSGSWGHSNSWGSQNLAPTAESRIYPYQAQLNMVWNLFDGGARQNVSARAEAEKREAESEAEVTRDRIENEIWESWTDLQTAREQQAAAEALLQAARQSYDAATEAFQAGVRNFLDVSTAQRDLARARTAEAVARVELLRSAADLAFRAADPVGMSPLGVNPMGVNPGVHH